MNMTNPGTGSLEIAKRIDELEKGNKELNNRIDAISKSFPLPFSPSEGITGLTVYKSGVGVVIRNFFIAANTKLPTIMHPGGYTYYVIGKIEGGNPLGLGGMYVIGAGMVFLAPADGGLVPISIFIYYDGMSTYLIQLNQYNNTVDISAIATGQYTVTDF